MIQNDFSIPSGNHRIFVSYYGKANDRFGRDRNCLVFAPGAWLYPGKYEEFIGEMAKNFDVISPHYLGHGRSNYSGTYTLDDLVQNVKDTIAYAAKKYDKVVLFGYSLGGIISSILAVEEGLPVNGIFCFTVIVPEMEETFKELVNIPFVKNRDQFLKVVDFLDRNVPKGSKFSEFLFLRNSKVGNLRIIKQLIRDPLSLKSYGKEFLLSILRMDMKDFLAKEIEYPFVMAASTGDGLIPWKYQREIYEKIKVKDNNKSFLLLDLPRTHMSLHERPKECAAKIIPAIERLFKC